MRRLPKTTLVSNPEKQDFPHKCRTLKDIRKKTDHLWVRNTFWVLPIVEVRTGLFGAVMIPKLTVSRGLHNPDFIETLKENAVSNSALENLFEDRREAGSNGMAKDSQTTGFVSLDLQTIARHSEEAASFWKSMDTGESPPESDSPMMQSNAKWQAIPNGRVDKVEWEHAPEEKRKEYQEIVANMQRAVPRRRGWFFGEKLDVTEIRAEIAKMRGQPDYPKLVRERFEELGVQVTAAEFVKLTKIYMNEISTGSRFTDINHATALVLVIHRTNKERQQRGGEQLSKRQDDKFHKHMMLPWRHVPGFRRDKKHYLVAVAEDHSTTLHWQGYYLYNSTKALFDDRIWGAKPIRPTGKGRRYLHEAGFAGYSEPKPEPKSEYFDADDAVSYSDGATDSWDMS